MDFHYSFVWSVLALFPYDKIFKKGRVGRTSTGNGFQSRSVYSYPVWALSVPFLVPGDCNKTDHDPFYICQILVTERRGQGVCVSILNPEANYPN